MVEGQRDGNFGQNSKLGHSVLVTKVKFSQSLVKGHVLHLDINISSSAHNFGCMVDGGNAKAAI